MTSQEDIITVLENTPDLSTLLTLVDKAGLAEALSQQGPNTTIFAPTNAAFRQFAQANPQLYNQITGPNGKRLLQDILKYHVVPERYESTQIQGASGAIPAQTLQGTNLCLQETTENDIVVNDAYVTEADIPTANGIVHIVNNVLNPRPDVPCPSYGRGRRIGRTYRK
jgi:uncharacterized surface protein with fasciclin (FAS1) repeats